MEEHINQPAVEEFVLQATHVTPDQRRTLVGRLQSSLGRAARPNWRGEKVNDETIVETIRRLNVLIAKDGRKGAGA